MGSGSRFYRLRDFTDGYILFKMLHLFGVILFLGKTIVTGGAVVTMVFQPA